MVKPGEGAFDDPTSAAQTRAVLALAAGDLGLDPAGAQLAPVLVVVVAAVGGQALGPSTWPPDRAAHGRHHALSAGTTPADRVHPEVVEVMAEIGLDLSTADLYE